MARRDDLARIMGATGMLQLMEKLPSRAQMIVVNHHRIGDRNKTQFDPEVFSATQDDLEAQLKFLKKNYEVLSPADVPGIVNGTTPLNETCVLITFDDGYLDNYELGLPVLEACDVEAVFFVVPLFFDNPHHISWWDEIGYMTQKAVGKEIRLSHPEPLVVTPTKDTMFEAISGILAHYRRGDTDGDKFFEEFTASTGIERLADQSSARLYMTWDEARAAAKSVVTIGAHTQTHQILGKLTPEEQRKELVESRDRLEKEFGEAPKLLAYPVGSPSAFSEETKRIAKEAGYEAAFSFHGGANAANTMDPYDLKRTAFLYGVDNMRNRASVATMAVSGNYWL